MQVARSNLGPVRLWAAQDALATGALRSGDRAEDLVALGTARLLLGQRQAAEDACAEALRLAPSRTAWVCVGNARLVPGRAPGARAAFAEAAALAGPVDARLAYQQARAEALAGDPGRGLEFLRLALALGYKDFGTVLRDPLLSNVRGMPEFRETYLHYVRHRRDRNTLPEG
jgi:tetratricopeptide (TPR) repeat protein